MSYFGKLPTNKTELKPATTYLKLTNKTKVFIIGIASIQVSPNIIGTSKSENKKTPIKRISDIIEKILEYFINVLLKVSSILISSLNSFLNILPKPLKSFKG